MSQGQHQPFGKGRRRRTGTILASAAVVLLVGPTSAIAGAGPGGEANADARMIGDATRTEQAVAAAYNDKQWNQLRGLYTDDAVVLPPNHEPVRGRDAIIDYLRSVRDVYGPIDGPKFDHVRVRGSANLADLVSTFTAQSGRLRVIGEALYERQSDGTVVIGVDQFGFRDQAGG